MSFAIAQPVGPPGARPMVGFAFAQPTLRRPCRPCETWAYRCMSRVENVVMQSRFVKADAEAMVVRYGEAGVSRDLAVRVYTTGLLGADRRLVLQGGGNTSVKTRTGDLMGREVEVLCVKGSGADMAAIEPAGLPAVRLAELRELRAREALFDEDMVCLQRANLIDPMAPHPSVETLLHAFVPPKIVDHTPSTAVLSLIDPADGGARAAAD